MKAFTKSTLLFGLILLAGAGCTSELQTNTYPADDSMNSVLEGDTNGTDESMMLEDDKNNDTMMEDDQKETGDSMTSDSDTKTDDAMMEDNSMMEK